MRTKGKIAKALSVVFIVFMVMSVAVTSVSATDDSQRNNAIDAAQYRMNLSNFGGLIYTNSNVLTRWNSNFCDDDGNVLGNHQGQFFSSTYVPAVNYWNNNIDEVVNNINSFNDDSVFSTYKNKLDKISQDYAAALAAGEGCLFSSVTKETVLQNNNDITVCVTNIDTAKGNFVSFIDEVETVKSQTNLKDSVNSTTEDLFNIPEALWDTLGTVIGTVATPEASVFGLSLDTLNIVANNLLPYINSLAYLVLVISFGISASQSALQFELYEPRGAAKVLLKLAFGKMLIDVSIRLCLAIIRVINSVAASAINVGISTGTFSGTDLTDILTGAGAYILSVTSANPLVIVSSLVSNIPKIVITVVIITSMVKVFIKLVMRNFELGCLLVVAPIGFATLAGEESKRYFSKYLGSLIGAASQILFIAITYNLVSQWLSNISNDTSMFSLGSEWLAMIIICAMGKFIWKPPASLSNIFT